MFEFLLSIILRLLHYLGLGNYQALILRLSQSQIHQRIASVYLNLTQNFSPEFWYDGQELRIMNKRFTDASEGLSKLAWRYTQWVPQRKRERKKIDMSHTEIKKRQLTDTYTRNNCICKVVYQRKMYFGLPI